MLQPEKSPPVPTDLAINRPEGGIHGYETSINAHFKYWRLQMEQAVSTVEPGRYDMALALRSILGDFGNSWQKVQLGMREPEKAERTRQVLLNALALSQLLRILIKPGVGVDDAIGYKTADLVNDMYSPDDDLPEPFRIHTQLCEIEPESGSLVPLVPSEPVDTWYKSKAGLYVHHVTPATPTTFTIGHIAEVGVSVDFAKMHTFYPYLPSRL